MASYLPALAIFNFECLLLPSVVGPEVEYLPLSKISNEIIIDKYGRSIKCNPEVLSIFEKLKNMRVEIAITAYARPLNIANQLINWFEWDKYISFRELNPGIQVTHLKTIQNKSGIPFHKMIYFDNVLYYIQTAKYLGIFSVCVNECNMTIQVVENEVKKYESSKNKINIKKEKKNHENNTNTT